METSTGLRSGICPHCGSNEVYMGNEQSYRGSVLVGLLSGMQMEAYICIDCGQFIEHAFLNPSLIEKIKKNWTKV